MLPPFNLHAPPQILFGPGKLTVLSDVLPRFGRRPLLVLGNKSFCKTVSYQEIQAIFSKLNISVEVTHIRAEPSPEVIDEIVTVHRQSDRDMVIAIGGGSVLDAGKALSAMLIEGGSITRFLEGVGTEKPTGNTLPFIAIPTTSGTGSEATSNAVISSVGKSGFKKSLRHDNFIADLALVDPNLTLSCPKEITVACSMDCFTQLVEGYLSTNSSRITDALALDGIKAVHRSLRAACADGDNLSARTDLAYGALLSGIVLANAGLGTIHGFASTIGGYFTIPHGVVCGTLMAAANQLTLKSLQIKGDKANTLQKFTNLGLICSGADSKSDVWFQDFFTEELERLTIDLAIPKLGDFGVTADDIGKLVSETGNKYNPVKLSEEELAKILQSRI